MMRHVVIGMVSATILLLVFTLLVLLVRSIIAVLGDLLPAALIAWAVVVVVIAIVESVTERRKR